MKLSIFVLLFTFITSFSNAQVVVVRDQETGRPIERATLSDRGTGLVTMTNAHGEADIKGFKGIQLIEIRKMGYKTLESSYADIQMNKFVLILTPTVVMIDKMVISATRWDQVSNDVPMKIATISTDDIILHNPQTAADLLGNSGEVFIQKSQQGGGSPMIRGFATNRLLYSVDGVRMNTAIFRSGNLQNVISLDPFAMGKTEVLFGPGSVIYGSDAIGGVMSFQTLTPQLAFSSEKFVSGNAVTRYSTANKEQTIHFDVNLGSRKWASITSFTSSDYGDLRMGSVGPDEYLRPFYVKRQDSVDVVVTNDDPRIQRPSSYSQINMMQKIRYQATESLEFNYGFHYSESSDYSRYDRHIMCKKGLPRYAEWYYGPQKWMMNLLDVTHTAKKGVYDKVSVKMAWQQFEESRVNRAINKSARKIRTENVDAYSANIDFVKGLGEKHQFFYGLEGVIDEVTSTGIDENISTGKAVPGAARYPQATWSSYAVYLSHQYKASQKMLLQTGIRYNQYLMDATFDTAFYPFPFTQTNISDGALTGSIGAIYKPGHQWVIHAGVATGFRSPNVDDLGKVYDSEPGKVVVPNPDLKAEYAWNLEVGITKNFGERLRVDLTGYYTLLQDALVRRNFTLNGNDSIMYDGEMSRVQAIQNAAIAKIGGIQAGFDLKLAAGFSINSTFNFQKGEEEMDDESTSPSRHAPPFFGISKLTFKEKDLEMQLYAVYSGKRTFEQMPFEEQGKTEMYAIDDNGNPWSPAWYTLNFKAMYQLTNTFIISAGVENITDRRYRPYSSGIVAPGRNLVISLRASF